MKRRIYIEPLGRVHSYLMELAQHPPEGYEFILPSSLWDKVLQPAWKSYFVYHTLGNLANRVIPVPLAKSYLEKFFRRTPPSTALTYAFGHLVFRKEPWILEVEYVHQLAGWSFKHLRRYQRFIENTLASPYCRKIVCWSEFTKKTLLSNLDCSSFVNKIEILYHAISAKRFTKIYNQDVIRLLFVGSANFSSDFELKGGKEAVEAFIRLKQKYPNIELVIRANVPPRLKDQYKAIPGIYIIDTIVPWEKLEEEYKRADIFIQPAHNTPFMAFLEAMAYELPVVATDLYATPEYVQHGKTGFLVRPHDKSRYEKHCSLPSGFYPGGPKEVKDFYPEVVEDLVEKLSILIENPELRRSMGRAGRWEVEEGKFSITTRNQVLKRILDEATANVPS